MRLSYLSIVILTIFMLFIQGALVFENIDIYQYNSYQNILTQTSQNDQMSGVTRAYENATIVLNEFLANPTSDWDGDLVNDTTGDEWVELYNYGSTSVNISSWYINDSVAKRYTFPGNTEIRTGGFYIAFGSNQSLGLNNGGDTIKLYNSSGILIDSYIYVTSDLDYSIGRVPDGACNWTTFSEPTPGYTNGGLPRIVINELMYDPIDSDTENEWIELFNNDSKTVELTNWQITDQDGEVDYIFEDVELPTQNYILISTGSGIDELDFSDNIAHLYMSKTTAMLNNDGDDVLLLTSDNLVVDYVAFGESSYIDPPLGGGSDWDGIWYDTKTANYTTGSSNPKAEFGCSIHRKNNGVDTNSILDWCNSSGVEITPGRDNNDVFGFECTYDKKIQYINTSDQAQFNIKILNIGKKSLTINLTMSEPTTGWSVEISKSKIELASASSINATIIITVPPDLDNGNELNLNLSLNAVNVNLTQNFTFSVIIPAVDLQVTKFSIDDSTSLTTIFEGEIVSLKATVNNLGLLTGDAFSVGFYYNEIAPENMIGSKNYDYILTTNAKYPSLNWDTLGFKGNFTLIIAADIYSEIVESNENNNQIKYNITILDTSPNDQDEQLLITEIFYDPSILYDLDEYVKIYNPTEISLDLSGWQLSDDPKKDIQETITIPENTWLDPYQELVITNDAEAFLHELGFEPDLACNIGTTTKSLELCNPQSWPGFANNGDLVVLRNRFRHIIDLISYGAEDADKYPVHWQGPAVNTIPEGKILKRQRSSEITGFIDTDTALDWEAPRLYAPGQSDFYPELFEFNGEVKPFASPENSFKVVMSELESAEKYIYLNAYEFTHPVLAEQLLEALSRNISVKLLLEGNPVGWNFTNIDDPEVIKNEEYTQKLLLTQLHEAGAEIKFLSNIKNDNKIKTVNKRYTYNHAKYVLLDGESTIIFSGNWKPTSLPEDTTYGNREWGISINSDEVTKYFEEVFFEDWTVHSTYQNDTHYYDLSSLVYGPPPEFFKPQIESLTSYYESQYSTMIQETSLKVNGNFIVEPILSPDTSTREDSGLLKMINEAEESVYIQQMDCNIEWKYSYKSENELVINWSDQENYFLNWLDGKKYYNKFLCASIAAAKRGCEVKIILDSRYVDFDTGPGNNYLWSSIDNLDVVQYINVLASKIGLEHKLEARLAYLSGLEMIHNKGVLVDGKKVLISSINWNQNSVANNREVGVIVENPQVAEFYNELFQHDWWLAKCVNNPVLPNSSERAILLTELYADTYLSRDLDEYLAIHNPSDEYVDISGWTITDKLTTYSGAEGVLIFPVDSMIGPKDTIYVARNAMGFYQEHGHLPDYEFINNSHPDVPQLELLDPSTATPSSRGVQLANKGDELVLADEYLFFHPGSEYKHIIDMIVYGNSSFISKFTDVIYPFNNSNHWLGRAVYNVSEGEILKRNCVKVTQGVAEEEAQIHNNTYIDTNTAADWENYHIYHPGQSELEFHTVSYTGSITMFSSPDSSYDVISSELDKATKSIYVSIYQFHNLYLMDKLMNASHRGVDVKIFIDGAPVGGITDLGRYVAKNLVDAGCQVSFIRSVSDENIHRRYNFLHNKYVIIDNITVIILSENWKTSGVPVVNTAGNRGWGIVLRNIELAEQYVQLFFSDWNPIMKDTQWYNSSDLKYGAPPEDFIPSWSVFGGYYKPRFTSKTINGEFKITPLIAPDNTLDKYGSVLEMIDSAKDSVYIEQMECYITWNTNGRKLENLYLEAAIDAARRGCDVKILLDSSFASPDNPSLDNYDTVQYINNVAKIENLTANLEARLIYLNGYPGRNELSLLHNKGVIVDSHKVLISSINWATGSVIKNRETGVIIENTQVAKFFTKIFDFDWNLTVQEYLEVYILHSDTREVAAGQETVYTISISNTQPYSLNLILSTTEFNNGWSASLDTDRIILPPTDQINSTRKEVKLTITAPSEMFIKNATLTGQDLDRSMLLLDLGLTIETSDMSAEVVYTKTCLITNKEPPVNKDEDENTFDRSMIDPWLVIIAIAVILIIGAVGRDIIRSKFEKKTIESENEEEETIEPEEVNEE